MPTDKVMFPAYYPGVDEERESTTFYMDFTIAERFGFPAVKETWRRAWAGWKYNLKYLTELCVVMNQKGWYWSGRGKEDICRWYIDRYDEIRNWVYDERNDRRFGEEGRAFFFRVLD